MGEKKDGEEKKDDEKKEGEEAIEEASEVDVSTTTAEKKTLMQKLMTIKRDLMANKKEEKVEEEIEAAHPGEEIEAAALSHRAQMPQEHADWYWVCKFVTWSFA